MKWKVPSRLCHIKNYLLLWKTLAPLPPRVGAPLPLAAAVKITQEMSIMRLKFRSVFFSSFSLNFGAIAAYRKGTKSLFLHFDSSAFAVSLVGLASN